MAAEYKLSYFDIAGLAEPIRMLFSYGGIEFTDFRFSKLEKWPAIKPSIPWGQVPILEYNGQQTHQSTAICRYVAKKVKLTGAHEWEDLEIDASVDTIIDLRTKIQHYFYEPDLALKESRKEPLLKEILPFYLTKIDSQVKNNGGYFVGGKLTWADIFFVASVKYFDDMLGKDSIADYPNLTSLKNKVLESPGIKAYLKKTAT